MPSGQPAGTPALPARFARGTAEAAVPTRLLFVHGAAFHYEIHVF